VAFHNASGDRAIIRGPESMVYSFLAHLQAAYDALPDVSAAEVTVRSIRAAAPVAAPTGAQEVLTSIQQQVAQNHSELLRMIANLTSAVQSPRVAPSAAPPVLQVERETPSSDTVFIPSVSTTVEGTGLTADEKTSSGDDLAAAAAALRAAKKQTTAS
jgi:hypothetical protein